MIVGESSWIGTHKISQMNSRKTTREIVFVWKLKSQMSPLKMKRVQSAQVTKVHRSMSDKSIIIGDVYDEPRR